LHQSARAALEAYLCRRRQVATDDDHFFISLRRRALLIEDVATAFRTAARAIGLLPGRKCGGPTPHSLRHTFAVRALESCPDGRDRVTKHMVALSTYLGHSHVAATYWYLEATPTLMRDIAQASEEFVTKTT
jgi:integrase